MRSKEIPDLWYQIRKKTNDIRYTLPEGVIGPFFNDEFRHDLWQYLCSDRAGVRLYGAQGLRRPSATQLQQVKDVGKVELVGLQDEKIWIELSNLKMATLGVPMNAVLKALEDQNSMKAAGFSKHRQIVCVFASARRFESVEEVRDFPIRVGDRTFRVRDVAEVWRGFTDPPAPHAIYGRGTPSGWRSP